jgi:hypothetical protein
MRHALPALLVPLLLAGAARAEDDVLRYRRSYGEALREARVRNVPVLVSRHKDF